MIDALRYFYINIKGEQNILILKVPRHCFLNYVNSKKIICKGWQELNIALEELLHSSLGIQYLG